MEKLIRAIVLKIFPEMQQQLHLLHFAQVVAIPLPPGGGEVYDWEEPYYGVNIQMLDAHWQLYGPIHEAVPCPIPAASHTRGLFGFPQVGTVVGVQFAYGDPERPVITQPYGFDKHLPALKHTELLWQRDPRNYIRMSEEGELVIVVQNDAVIRVGGNADIQISGWGQIVATGRLLVKSATRLILKGPSRTEVL